MNVALHHHFSLAYGGGGERFIINIAKELCKRGHYVEVYALPVIMEGGKRLEPKKVLEDIPYTETWKIKVKDFDVAYYVYAPMLSKLHVNLAPKIAGLHSLLWSLQNPLQHRNLISTMAFMIWKIFGKYDLKSFQAIKVYYIEQLEPLSFLKNNYNLKIYIIPQEIDIEIFRPKSQKEDKFTVMFCGRPVRQKGFDLFLNIAHKLKNEGMNFIYVGGNVKDNVVRSLGYINDPNKLSYLYSKSHVVISPQRVPTFGRATLEALACGTPVIISTKLRPPYNSTKALIEAWNINQFIKAIKELRDLWINDKKTYMKLCKDGRNFIKQYFSKEKIFHKFENMLKEVAFS